MTIETVRGMLLWSGLINYAFLLIWIAIAIFARGFYHRIASWFGVSARRHDEIQFQGILSYKLAIWVLNLGPYLALLIVK